MLNKFHQECNTTLALLADKLKVFGDALAGMKEAVAKHMRTRLANFPFSHWLAGGNSDHALRWLQGLIVWLTIILLPLAVLVFAQLGFLPYQDESITWAQRLSVLADVCLLGFFWPSIVAPGARRWRWWLGCWRRVERCAVGVGRRWPYRLVPGRRGSLRLGFISLLAIWVVLFVATIPKEPWETRLIYWNEALGGTALGKEAGNTISCMTFAGRREFKFERHESFLEFVESGESPDKIRIALPSGMEALCPTALLFHSEQSVMPRFHRSLTVVERVLIANTVPPELLAKIGGDDAGESEQALERVESLNPRARALRFPVFGQSGLYRVDLRQAQLQGANLGLTELQGANLALAQLQGANLSGARLQGANLGWAQLQGANLSGTQLQVAALGWAQLQGANLTAAQLQVAELGWAQLQGANLSGTQLQGADLTAAQLQGANLYQAQLQGANLYQAQLQGANLYQAQLQGADLSQAQLQGADLTVAQLQGAVFKGAALDLNRLFGVNTSKWPNKEAEAMLAHMKKKRLRYGWFSWLVDEFTDRARKRKGTITAGFVPKHCVGDIRYHCKKELTMDSAMRLANLLAGLACEAKAAVAEPVARNVYSSYLRVDQAKASAADTAFRHILAKRLLNPKCTGRGGITADALTRMGVWAGSGLNYGGALLRQPVKR